MKYSITPECWTQPGAMRYTYIAPDKTLWNLSSVDDNAHLWSISAYGSTNRRSINKYEFDSTYKPHNQPSLYEAMDKASKSCV